MISRREFIKNCALVAGCALMPLGIFSWALAAPRAVERRLIVVMLRGAVDGLNVVTPYHEQAYYAARPRIAVPPPGQENGLLDLDGFFGLHPALQPMMPFWQNKSMAFIHASGSPATTRSHFEAQDILETAHLNNAGNGWLNNLIALLPDTGSPSRAISIGAVLPKIFTGNNSVASLNTRLEPAGKMVADNPHLGSAYAQLYADDPALSKLYTEGRAAHEAISADLAEEIIASAKGAPKADAFVTLAGKLAGMINRDPHIQLAFLDVGGWDTHVNQGGATGALANNLEKLGNGLAALCSGLGSNYSNTAILVMSEFGRTVAENGDGGTDHGHGNVMWLLGGGVRGGKVWGRWPGLNTPQLYEGRDLAITTDFRSVIGATLGGHFGLGKAQIASLLEHYQADSSLQGIVI